MWVGVEFYTILMKWCKNWCGLEMLLRDYQKEFEKLDNKVSGDGPKKLLWVHL